jgi:acyl-CoA synthetase (AMP-forming)/AMP-acid ligase II
VTKHEAIDFAGLEEAVGRTAAALLASGLAPGDRLASWLAKTRLACVLPLACARAGLVHVPVNPLLKRAQVQHILEDSGAALLIANEGRLATLEPGGRHMAEEAFVAADHALPPSSADPGALVQLLYTSGSTGRPKGVMLSHANLWLGAVSVARYLRLAADDVTLAVLPLSFDYGQNQLLSAWMAGSCVVPLDYLTARDVARAVARHGATTLAGVPPLWVQLADAEWARPTTLRRLTNSGGRLPVPLIRRLRTLFPEADLYSMYGLTEAFRSTFLDPALVDAHPDAIGDAIPFADIHVLDSDGREAAAGEAGELVHAGPLVGLGYWRDVERTAHRFREFGGGTAVWSGDTVVRGEDGLLRFVGRDDEMIKTSGNRVSPNEIEEAAIASGATAEAVAIGVPDDRLGQAVLLICTGDGAEEAALRAHLKAELPGFMQPREILWRSEFPRNPNGKLDRAAIRREVIA